MTHRFHQVDVFSEPPLQGNPLAVIHAAEGLTDAQMAALARWTNLSETSFLLRPATRRPTTAFASGRRAVNCPSPATRPWAAAGPGWPPTVCRRPPIASCSNVAWGSSRSGATAPGDGVIWVGGAVLPVVEGIVRL